nr:uncharacterized protein LOC110791591 isoform X2 [Spinacia oleracea]
MTRTMKECGSPIIDEMISDIKASLSIMSTKQPVRGVIQRRTSSYHQVGSNTWARSAVSNQNDVERSGGYFSSVLKSAKEKAANLTWPQPLPSGSNQPLPSGSNQVEETDELPISSEVSLTMDGKSQLTLPEEIEFDEFKADREARLEEWLDGPTSILRNESCNTQGHGHGHHLLDSL